MDEMDEVGQELDRALRVTLTGAGQLAERIARRNEEQARELQRAAGEQARALREQLEGERQAGRLMWRPAVDVRWWDAATERDASRAWQYAAGWAAEDPQAYPAEVDDVADIGTLTTLTVRLHTGQHPEPELRVRTTAAVSFQPGDPCRARMPPADITAWPASAGTGQSRAPQDVAARPLW